MAACTRCGFQQNGAQAYCERCGMFLPSLAVYNPGQPEAVVAPQVLPPQVIFHPKQRFLEGNLTTAMILDRCIREGIAIIGLFIAAFGGFGALDNLLGGGWALLLGLVVLVGGIAFVSRLFFVQKRVSHLRWSHILISGILATMGLVILLVMVSAIVQTNVMGRNLGYGIALFLYGLVLAALVVW